MQIPTVKHHADLGESGLTEGNMIVAARGVKNITRKLIESANLGS